MLRPLRSESPCGHRDSWSDVVVVAAMYEAADEIEIESGGGLCDPAGTVHMTNRQLKQEEAVAARMKVVGEARMEAAEERSIALRRLPVASERGAEKVKERLRSSLEFRLLRGPHAAIDVHSHRDAVAQADARRPRSSLRP